ncbi:MAG: hypothetical protein WC551_11310 [Patescibacteria group bacterium]
MKTIKAADNSASEKLAAWAENVKAAAIQGAAVSNAFNMGLWYGEDGKAKIPKRVLDENGDIRDDTQLLWFNLGVQWYEEWKAAEPMIQAALLKGLALLIATAFAAK